MKPILSVAAVGLLVCGLTTAQETPVDDDRIDAALQEAVEQDARQEEADPEDPETNNVENAELEADAETNSRSTVSAEELLQDIQLRVLLQAYERVLTLQNELHIQDGMGETDRENSATQHEKLNVLISEYEAKISALVAKSK